jgi:hypothetical protein
MVANMDTIERLGSVTQTQLTNAKSIDFVRWVSALYQSDGIVSYAAEIFAERWPGSVHRELVTKAVGFHHTKAASAFGTTFDAVWAGPLTAVQPLADAFLEYSRPLSIIGKIPNLRKVPFNVAVSSQSTAGTYGWIGEGKVKFVTNPTYASVALTIAKAAGVIVVSEELLKLSARGAETALRAEMAAGIAQYLDGQFTDPAIAAVANTNPASITNGVTPITATGTSASNLLTDLKALITAFFAANPSAENAVLIMTPQIAVAAAIAANVNTLGIQGGTIFGVPVVTSGSVGARIVMLDASAIVYADAGVEIDLSRQALIQLDSAPDDPPDGDTVMISTWQLDLVGLRTERFINWKRSRLSAVHFIETVAYV